MSKNTKSEQVESMFDSIAHKYDFLNHFLSFGIDKLWRKRSLEELKKVAPKSILDVATGTGDLAIKAKKVLTPDTILGIDISEQMLAIAKKKCEEQGYTSTIKFDRQSCMSLTLDDESFDAVIVAFGVRNFENLEQGLREISRVLKPSGKLMILELTTPQSFPIRQLYTVYSEKIIPLFGRILAHNREAYSYLPNTIKSFIQGRNLVNVLLKSGFTKAHFKEYTFGICSMYLAEK